jgi:hypothetical protein
MNNSFQDASHKTNEPTPKLITYCCRPHAPNKQSPNFIGTRVAASYFKAYTYLPPASYPTYFSTLCQALNHLCHTNDSSTVYSGLLVVAEPTESSALFCQQKTDAETAL